MIYKLSVIRSFIFFNIKYKYNITLTKAMSVIGAALMNTHKNRDSVIVRPYSINVQSYSPVKPQLDTIVHTRVFFFAKLI